MKNIACIIAGGAGERMRQSIPKQFLNVNNIPVIVYTLKAFQECDSIDAIIVVSIEGWENFIYAYSEQFHITKLKSVVKGGKTGQESIKHGIDEIKKYYAEDDIVLIHDAIRPMVSPEIIMDCIRVTMEKGSAIAVIPCQEAMLETDDQISTTSSYPRDRLKRTQTPQGFPLGKLLDLHKRAGERGITNSIASCTLAVELGETIYFSKGSEKNIKLTTTEDMEIFDALLGIKKAEWLHD